MYIVHKCFGLSDEGTEGTLYNSEAIRPFVGVDLSREACRMRPRCCTSGACGSSMT